MSKLKVFVSSTCYDLGMVRAQLRSFIKDMGHDPVMSDYADVLYDPRVHTHESCVQEVSNADVLILIIGSRFGGKSIPKAMELIDFEEIDKMSSSKQSIKDQEKISITQLEVFKAMYLGIPVFTFVDDKVLHDHLTYEKNKDKPFLMDIDFPAFQYNKDAAKYVFEFINFMRLRYENNSICGFNKIEDIEEFLRKQWSSLFQRLLYDYRNDKHEAKKMEVISEQIADIKTALMTSISNSDLKDTARGAIKFRQLIQSISELYMKNVSDSHSQDSSYISDVLLKDISWDELINDYIGIEELIENSDDISEGYVRQDVIIKTKNNKYFKCRMGSIFFNRLSNQWNQFKDMSMEAKKAIIEAVNDNDITKMPPFFFNITKRYIDKNTEGELEACTDENK